MTVELCIQFCDTQGFIYAGTEFGVSTFIRNWSPFHLFSCTFVYHYAIPLKRGFHHLLAYYLHNDVAIY